MDNTFFSGNTLKDLVEAEIGSHKYKRKIIKDILNIINQPRMVSIVGDRRRGKTTTLFSLIKELNCYDKSVYVSLNQKTSIDELREKISKNYRDFYVFIDEITNIKDLDIIHQQVTDSIKPFCKKLFISGTWSQSTIGYERRGWFDRVDIFKLNPITPIDSKIFLNQNFDKFMLNGGYIQDMREDVSFIDSFDQYYYLFHKDMEEIAFTKYALAMLLRDEPFKVEKANKLKEKNFSNIFKILNKSIEDVDIVEIKNTKVLREDIEQIWGLLRKKGIAKRIQNLSSGSYKWINSDILSLWTVMKALDFENILFSKGLLMESYLLRYSKNINAFLRSNNNEEIDGIDIINEMLFEIKHKDKITEKDLIHLKNKRLLDEYGLGDFSKNIIYLGETKEEKDICYWNIYDYVREFMEEHLLEPWEYFELRVNLDWI